MKKNQFLLVSLFLIASLLVPAVTGDTQTRSGTSSQTLTSSLFVPSASAEDSESGQEPAANAENPENETPAPEIPEENLLPEDPQIMAHSAILVDLNSGGILYGKNEHEKERSQRWERSG